MLAVDSSGFAADVKPVHVVVDVFPVLDVVSPRDYLNASEYGFDDPEVRVPPGFDDPEVRRYTVFVRAINLYDEMLKRLRERELSGW